MHLSGYRILLAEDNELNAEIARELLTDIGMEVAWAEDGRSCLKKMCIRDRYIPPFAVHQRRD